MGRAGRRRVMGRGVVGRVARLAVAALLVASACTLGCSRDAPTTEMADDPGRRHGAGPTS
ncbi:MAG: hypothetical protein V9E94_17400 [Microthrixaceae bacterium]